jgi:hypothetical protein
MRRSLIALSGLAVLGLLATTTPAAAAGVRTCNAWYPDGLSGPAVGAYGGGSETLASRNSLTDVYLTVTDKRADGHHVRIRLVTRRSDGTNHYWAWHAVHSGAGTFDSWVTTATDSGGIRLIWHEVAVFEGDSKLGSCTTAAINGF